MYEQLDEADSVIADLSTANPNAFFELGVRYALKPRTTIVIAEKGFKIPFDMGQVIVRHYVHLGLGIDFEEVEKFRAELTKACQEVAAAERVDSPVYTFLTRLQPPGLKEAAAAAEATAKVQTAQALATATDENERDALTYPFAEMMAKAMAARARKDFKQARAILGGIKAAQGDDADSFVVQQLALLTYKSEDLDPRQRLLDARECLRPLAPGTSADPELLGLWGSIHKRLSEIGVSAAERREALDVAIAAYQSGYFLKTDYYNGINYAFLLDTRAAQSTGDDAIADRVFARRVREHVLTVCEAVLAAGVKGESPRAQVEQDYWVRATKVEALFGLRWQRGVRGRVDGRERQGARVVDGRLDPGTARQAQSPAPAHGRGRRAGG